MKARYIFILAVIFALIAIVALRFNNKKAEAMAQQIHAKDALNVDVKNDIVKLQQFSVKHMNGSVKLELTASFKRAEEAAKAGNLNVDGAIYAEAQAACDRQGVGSVAQAQCVQEYLSTRVSPNQSTPTNSAPNKSQYIYAFSSPTWTPDIAGFSLLASLALGLTALGVYIYGMFRTRA